tara:strand:+ start:27 stop:1286 length:1260 start_codon:yes stop_codon:yes gene_type:complete
MITLHPHQKIGVEYLLSREQSKNSTISGSILADQMGLGKTIQTIKLIELSPHLITLLFCPSSLLYMWENQIAKFSNCIDTIVYNTNNQIEIALDIHKKNKTKLVIICSYGLSHRRHIFKSIEVDRIVCDEAHYFRNPKSKAFLAINNIKSKSRLALTGTPIQNSIKDITTLINFILCRNIKMDIDFIKLFLRERMLYRTLESVGIKMPTLTITHNDIEIKGDNKRVVSLTENIECNSYFERIIRTKQACVFPQMLNKSKFEKKYNIHVESSENQKTEAVLKSVNSKKEKCIIFTEYISEQEYYSKHLDKDYKIAIIRGSTPVEERIRICSDTSYDILLIQIQTGCVGLNLQHYSVIYFTNFQWNPSITEQAIGRINRLGQKNKMTVYFYKIKNTIEERIQFVCKEKRKIIKNILEIKDF